jgi:hypothetical protein
MEVRRKGGDWKKTSERTENAIKKTGRWTGRILDHMPAPGFKGHIAVKPRINPSQSENPRIEVWSPIGVHMHPIPSIRGHAVKPKDGDECSVELEQRTRAAQKARVPRGGATPKETNLGIPCHDATQDDRSGTNVTMCHYQLRQVLIFTASCGGLGA